MARIIRILVVEDHEPEWQLYRAGLASLPCHCEFCKWGEDALTKAQGNIYDLIFFDLGLPQGSASQITNPMSDVAWGEFVFSRLRFMHKGPMILITSHSDSFPGSPAIARMKPDACMAKVVTPEEINQTARKFLGLGE